MLYCVTSKHRQHSHLFESSFCQKVLHVNLSPKYGDGCKPGLCPVLNCQMKMLYMLVSFCLCVQIMCLTSHLGCSMIFVCHDSLQWNCSIIISISIHPSILVFGADAAFTEAFQCWLRCQWPYLFSQSSLEDVCYTLLTNGTLPHLLIFVCLAAYKEALLLT